MFPDVPNKQIQDFVKKVGRKKNLQGQGEISQKE